MTLKQDLAADVAQIFVDLDDIPVSIEYHSVDSTYSTTTQNNTENELGGGPFSISGILYEETKDEDYSNATVGQGNAINKVTKNCIVRQAELPVTPRRGFDYIVEPSGTRFNVIDIAEDPASVIWILSLKKG